ncbi:unnamed protein product [Triticum turgidum subsp. durum]|uniref:Uncharacterized protein n=1 Tax=Triticum turgidum subsp. durum TaxID=4567 RepID=A0A9R1QWT2_TRITD|nr:unnamed protein product [Triticum turgidum subsp. durum]
MKGGDVEAGGTGTAALKAALYPGTTESPELRWELIRKTYVVLFLQLLLTAVVAVVVYKCSARCTSTARSTQSTCCCLASSHFTVAITFSVGFMRSFYSGKVIWEAGMLTIVVVLSLTAYTFWAARRGKDFSFLGPFLFASLMILLVFGFIQVRCRPFHSLVRC